MTKAEIEERLAQYRDNLRSMQTERWVGQFAEDAVVEDPVGAPAVCGREALTAFFNSVRQSYALLDMTPEFQIVTPPGAAVVKWSVLVVPRSGDKVTIQGITTFRFREDGKMTQMSAYYVGA